MNTPRVTRKRDFCKLYAEMRPREPEGRGELCWGAPHGMPGGFGDASRIDVELQPDPRPCVRERLHLLQADSPASVSRTFIFLSAGPGRRNRRQTQPGSVVGRRTLLCKPCPSESRSNCPEIQREEGSRAHLHLCCCLLARCKCFLQLSHHPRISHLPPHHFRHPGHGFAAAVQPSPWGCSFPAEFVSESKDTSSTGVENSRKQHACCLLPASPPDFHFRSSNATAPLQQQGEGGSRSPGDRSGSASSLPARPPRERLPSVSSPQALNWEC